MEIAIFDTSVWIDFSKGIKSSGTILLKKYLNENITALYLTPTVIQEFLMGLRTENDFMTYKRYFETLNIFELDWKTVSISSAKLFFDLKKKVVTIKKSTDCLIAQIAIDNNTLLVHNDSDFDFIAQNSELRVYV
jgi:predicted nucleic acid-binding protein